MRGRSYNLDLEKENFRSNTSYGQQIHPAGLDPSTSLSALARAKTGGDPLDLGAPRYYRLETHRRLSLLDYMDFLRRPRWKLCHQTSRPLVTDRYLDILNWPQPWVHPFVRLSAPPSLRMWQCSFQFASRDLWTLFNDHTFLKLVTLLSAMTTSLYKP